jgi:hypothetical protein
MRQNLLAVAILAAPLSACMVLGGTDHPVADDATAKASISGLPAPGYVWLYAPENTRSKLPIAETTRSPYGPPPAAS